MNFLADSSGLYAYFDSRDAGHARASEVLERSRDRLIVASTVTEELFTLLRRRVSYRTAWDVAAALRSGEFGPYVQQSDADRLATWAVLREFSGVRLSYVDASIVVLARNSGIRRVFSLDDDLRQCGLDTLLR